MQLAYPFLFIFEPFCNIDPIPQQVPASSSEQLSLDGLTTDQIQSLKGMATEYHTHNHKEATANVTIHNLTVTLDAEKMNSTAKDLTIAEKGAEIDEVTADLHVVLDQWNLIARLTRRSRGLRISTSVALEVIRHMGSFLNG